MSSRPFVHLHCHSPLQLARWCKLHIAAGSTNCRSWHEFFGASRIMAICMGRWSSIEPAAPKTSTRSLVTRRTSRPGADATVLRPGQKESNYHLTLLCKNEQGFRNLVKMASHASLEGFYFKPRIDKELLETYNEGIICLSGCVSSEFSRAILRGGNGAEDSLREAKEVAAWFHQLFGDRYFIEIMNNNVDIQRPQLEGAVELANQMGLPLVATSDCHYVDREDAEAQDVMLCINMGKFRTDSARMKMEGSEFYLRPPEENVSKLSGVGRRGCSKPADCGHGRYPVIAGRTLFSSI